MSRIRTRTFAGRLVVLALGICFALATATSTAAQEDSAPQPAIRSAAEIDYPPFSIVDDDGVAGGFSVELLRATLAAMDHEVTFRSGPWSEVRGWLERGEVQALPLVGRTPEREALFDFTVPYMTLHGAIVVRAEETGIRDLADLRGRRVAVMKGDNVEEFLRREDRGIVLRTTPTFETALRELAAGRHDAVVVQRLVALRLIQQAGLTDLRVLDRPVEGFEQDFCFAVREGDRRTLALLNEGLALVMADGTYRHLHARWFAAMQLPSSRPIVIGGDRNFPPYEFLDENGHPAGYNVDLTRAIAREMGLNVEIRLGHWPERLQALASGRIDALQGMYYSTERDLRFDFTPAHAVSHYVAVVRAGEGPPPESIEELVGKQVVVERDDILHDFAVEHGLTERLAVVDDQEEALKQLVAGRYDCALVSRATVLFLMEKHGWTDLEPARKPLLVPEYCYATGTGRAALLAQLGEGLRALESSGEYRRIHDEWLGIYQDEENTLLDVLRISARIIIPLAVVLLVVLAWSWTLRRQVGRKTGQLRESLDRFRHVFESSNVGKSITRPTGEVDVNQAFARFLGYEPSELRGKRWQDLTPPEDVEAVEATIAPLLTGDEESVRFEKRYVHRSGEFLWADVSAALHRDRDGRPLYFVTTIVDINDRKRAEAALRRSEEYQRAMITCSPVALYTVDLEGKVLSWNNSAERIFGWRADEVVGRALPIVPAAKRDEFDALRRLALDEGGFSGRELERVRKDGVTIPISLSVAPVRSDGGEVVGILEAAVDIAERRQAEAEHERLQSQLLQAQKMESVGRLAGGVAHDFNNMLNVIMGFADLALERTEPASPLRRDLQEVLKAAGRAAEITRQLLAFARRQTIDPRAIDLNETLEDMLRMLRRLLGEDIDLMWQPGPGRMTVFMDPSQLDQILANLCVNARDAIDGVGKLTIETGRVTFDEEYCAEHAGFVPGDFIMLAVSDDGCGMDAATLENVFDPFYTTKDLGEGTGLGLATVFGIVKQNGGFINVYSEPGRGTTFRVYLRPHAGDIDRIMANSVTEIPAGRGETVLVVEDEDAILTLTRKILERLGYVVLTASAPGEAVALAEELDNLIHLVITDVIMPEMNGRDLGRELQARYPDLRVLFMSGYTANVIAHQGVLDEGVHFLQKPFSNRELGLAVRKALDG